MIPPPTKRDWINMRSMHRVPEDASALSVSLRVKWTACEAFFDNLTITVDGQPSPVAAAKKEVALGHCKRFVIPLCFFPDLRYRIGGDLVGGHQVLPRAVRVLPVVGPLKRGVGFPDAKIGVECDIIDVLPGYLEKPFRPAAVTPAN